MLGVGEMVDQVKGQAFAKAIQVLIQGNDLTSISRLKARRHNDRQMGFGKTFFRA
ncbi:MAG: hypothetical protein HYW48_10270 [Deltaproteobacteria bacterium]|nr:hypothetical protein [Deltaproteobacteria bacterium]